MENRICEASAIMTTNTVLGALSENWLLEPVAKQDGTPTDQWHARRYDGDREWPNGVSLGADKAPAIAWIQCIMPQLRKDAEVTSEHDESYPIYHAMLV